MRDKVFSDPRAALQGLHDGMIVLVGGFGDAGVPCRLISAAVAMGIHDLTVVSNNCGMGEQGVAELFRGGCVSRILASFPSQEGNHHFLAALRRHEVVLEVVPQGTLVERLHAGGSGLGGILTPTAVGTILAKKQDLVKVDGRDYVLARPIRGDVALLRAQVADTSGNLRYRRAARNFNPLMAMAAELTIVEVDEVVGSGAIDPDDVHTAGVFVDRIVCNSVQGQTR